MFYYLIEDDIPVMSQHKKQLGEEHYRDIGWSKIKRELSEEQYEVGIRLLDETRKGGKTTIPQSRLEKVLGMELVTSIMVAAINCKPEPRTKSRTASTNTRKVEEYEYRDEVLTERSPEEERDRLLHINVRAILEGNKVHPIAENNREFAKQVRKAIELRSTAGLELMLRAAERPLVDNSGPEELPTGNECNN